MQRLILASGSPRRKDLLSIALLTGEEIELVLGNAAQFKASSVPGFIVQTGQAKSETDKVRSQEPIEKPIIGMEVLDYFKGTILLENSFGCFL